MYMHHSKQYWRLALQREIRIAVQTLLFPILHCSGAYFSVVGVASRCRAKYVVYVLADPFVRGLISLIDDCKQLTIWWLWESTEASSLHSIHRCSLCVVCSAEVAQF